MHSADHHVMPYIEFPPPVEQRLLDILLDNIGLLLAIGVFLLLLYNGIELVYLIDYCYSLSPVGQLPRFYNPDILTTFHFLHSFELIREAFVVGIIYSSFDVVSKGNDIEDIFVL